MKKLLMTLSLALLAVCAFAQSGSLHIEGTNPQFGDTAIIVNASTPHQETTHVGLTNHKLSYDLAMQSPGIVVVYVMPAQKTDRGVRMMFLGVPGEKAVLTVDGSHYYVSGSKFYKQFNEIDRATENLNDEKAIANYVVDYAKKNPKSEAPVAMLTSLDYEGMQALVAALSPEVRNGRMKSYIDNTLEQVKALFEREQIAAKKQAAGVEAPDFTLTDINGKPFTLSSLRGKYVLLDFWGSWCGWCIKGMPQMKEYYKKYAGKYEIVGVDCNDTDEKWRAAVQKYELPWIHVYNTRDSKVTENYGIQGYPTKILIGPDGKIVKTIIGEDPAFYTFLDEQFGK
jgi:thiol-disulfide isomerase/thioredoxin